MKNLVAPLFALLLVASLVGLLACEDEDVGLPCQITNAVDAGTAHISLQAIDCRSRLCLRFGEENKPMCTKTCDSDGDCPDGDGKWCKTGFRCIVATETTKLSCCKMCVCKDGISPDYSEPIVCKDNPNPDCPDL